MLPKPEATDGAAPSKAPGLALGLLKKKNLGMTQPAGTEQGGLEFYVDPSLAPKDIKIGDKVCVYATVTKTGSEISMSPSSVELASEEAGEPKDSGEAEPAHSAGRSRCGCSAG